MSKTFRNFQKDPKKESRFWMDFLPVPMPVGHIWRKRIKSQTSLTSVLLKANLISFAQQISKDDNTRPWFHRFPDLNIHLHSWQLSDFRSIQMFWALAHPSAKLPLSIAKRGSLAIESTKRWAWRANGKRSSGWMRTNPHHLTMAL